ncbi:MAG: CPBP family intramembrane metalloprotease [Armatimonadetes bacterium]|nr:CPBP family intramembrane metalloprotease [Armatimonadota bacterium]
MSLVQACSKLAAYLVCIGLALEFSHRLYWHLNKQVSSLDASTFCRSFLSAVVACIPLGAAVGITTVFVKYVDKRSISTLGLTYTGDSLTRVAYGAAIALGCVTVVFLTGILMGFIEVKRSKMSEDCMACLPLFLGGVIDFFTASVFEEIIFRGYVFFLLLEAAGAEVAIVASSIVFAIAHVIKHPSIPILYAFNAFIFGTLAAICRYFTGSLWLPIGLHFGWNVVSGPIFGLPYSGKPYDKGVVVSDVSGPMWLTGGRYSLDAGVLGTLALMIAAVGLIAVTPLR